VDRLIKKDKNMDNSGMTAEKIFTAARAVFAENGYSGTRMDKIAERAGVNKATLYYQIGDKDTLYANVIHQVIGNIAAGIAESVAKVDTPEEKLKVHINGLVAAVNKNPELPPIMMRELAGGGTHVPRVVMEDMVSVISILFSILEQGKKKGVFSYVSPFLIHMMIMGTIFFYTKSTPIKDKQQWLPATIKARDIKLKGSLGEEVSKLVLKAIKA